MNAPVSAEDLHFSVTQLKTWLICPRKFEYRYVRNVDQEFTPWPLAFGSAFHHSLAHHYGWLMRGEPAPIDEVKARFVDSLTQARNSAVPLQDDDDDGTGFDEAVAKGLQMLDVTLAHPSARPQKVLAVESPFIVDLFDVETGEVSDARLIGVLDLVIEEEACRVLVEHKTSSRKYGLDRLVNDSQVSGYAYAARRMGWGEVGLRFSITSKAKNPQLQIEDVRRDDGDQADFLRQATGVLRCIDAGVSFPLRGWACRSCPYKSRCSAER